MTYVFHKVPFSGCSVLHGGWGPEAAAAHGGGEAPCIPLYRSASVAQISNPNDL